MDQHPTNPLVKRSSSTLQGPRAAAAAGNV